MPPHCDLVLVPGLLCTRDVFAPQQTGLPGHVQIVVADHAGADTLAAIAANILASAPPRFALAGLSMGGYIAFEMLRQAPDRITRLALISSNARADRPEQAAQRRALVELARAEGIGEVAGRLLPYMVHQDRLADRALADLIGRMAVDTGVDVFARQQEALIGRPDNRPFLAQIRCPTTIIVGADDAMTPVKVAQEVASGISGSALQVIPHCGHLATLEQPGAVNRILAGWLTA